jgi:hypothetical protein
MKHSQRQASIPIVRRFTTISELVHVRKAAIFSQRDVARGFFENYLNFV